MIDKFKKFFSQWHNYVKIDIIGYAVFIVIVVIGLIIVAMAD